MKNTNEYKLYELNLSQEVVKMQLQFSIFKRIMNITMSATTDEDIDFDIMKTAFNKCVERNDCLRLQFVKKNHKVMQYFLPELKFETIPCMKFNTQEEQDNFIKTEGSKTIKYFKGEEIKPFFIKTFDGKSMILVKVCHWILDNYGLNNFFKDLFEVYYAIKNNTELPALPSSFEEILKKDIEYKNNKEIDQKNREFFTEYYKDKEEPYYAGIHGLNSKLAKKHFNTHLMKMFFVKNDTKPYMFPIDKQLSENIIDFCKNNKITPANLLFYASSITQSKLNNNVKNILQLELCNCRATALERNCAGTKVQSLGCYITVEHEKSAIENLKNFCSNQNLFYRHLGFSDFEFQALTHKTWKSTPIKTYYAMSFSFIPVVHPKNVHYQVYSNGKFALPSYVAAMYDVETNEINMVYDCQIKLIDDVSIEYFHNSYVNVIKQIIKNPEILIKDIKLGE